MIKPEEKIEIKKFVVDTKVQRITNEILSKGSDQDLEKFLISKRILTTTNIKGREAVTGVHTEIYTHFMEAKKVFYETKQAK